MDCNDVKNVNIDDIFRSVHLLCRHDNYCYCWEWALHLDPLENLLEWLPFDSILKKHEYEIFIWFNMWIHSIFFFVWIVDCFSAPHLVYIFFTYIENTYEFVVVVVVVVAHSSFKCTVAVRTSNQLHIFCFFFRIVFFFLAVFLVCPRIIYI